MRRLRVSAAVALVLCSAFGVGAEEREQSITALKSKCDHVNAKYQKMTHMVNLTTVGKIKRKETMEKELKQLQVLQLNGLKLRWIFKWLLTATLSPRMKVDNGITFYTYYGDKVSEQKYSELYAVKWRPHAPGVFPDRPQSPPAALAW